MGENQLTTLLFLCASLGAKELVTFDAFTHDDAQNVVRMEFGSLLAHLASSLRRLSFTGFLAEMPQGWNTWARVLEIVLNTRGVGWTVTFP